MIEPQIHNGQRSMLGQHHGLQRLTDTLEALTKGQSAQQQRETQIQTQLATQAQHLATLTTGSTRLLGAVGVLAVLTLGLGSLVAYARALGAVDATLMQTWSTLPKGTQEAVTTTYTRLGLVPPGQRK
jgi:hypothetical protein